MTLATCTTSIAITIVKISTTCTVTTPNLAGSFHYRCNQSISCLSRVITIIKSVIANPGVFDILSHTSNHTIQCLSDSRMHQTTKNVSPTTPHIRPLIRSLILHAHTRRCQQQSTPCSLRFHRIRGIRLLIESQDAPRVARVPLHKFRASQASNSATSTNSPTTVLATFQPCIDEHPYWYGLHDVNIILVW